MSDNIQLNSGSGGATLATDDVGGLHYQIVKLAHGSLDSATLVSASSPLPISDAGGSLTVDVVTLPSLPAGTNNIGDVDVLTQPARAATSDSIAAKLATDALHDGTTALAPKFANISAASSGNNALVTAVAGKKIRVLAIALIATDAVALYFNDGTADLFADSANSVPLDETGATGSGGFVLGFNPLGWFETADVNRPLNVNLSAAVGVCGSLVYVEV